MQTAKKRPKKASIFLFLAVFLTTLLLGLVSPLSNQKVFADENLDKLCIPAHKELGGDNWETDAFEFEVISRVEIKVTYKETGNCKTPSDLSSQYIHGSGIAFAPFANQSLFLKKLGANSKDYVIYGVGENGSSAQGDETLIKTAHWTDVFSTKADSKNWDSYINRLDGTIDKIFKDSQYTIGIEEDLIDVASCSGTNSNFHLINKNSDGKGVVWECDNDSTNYTGASVSGKLNQQSKPNFNIVFKANLDGTILTSLLSDDPEFSFKYCADGKFRNDSCNGNKFIDGLTPGEVVAVGTGTKKIQIKESGKSPFDAVFAGSGNSARGDPGETETGGLGDSVTHVDCQTGGSLWNPLDNIVGWILCPLVDGAQGIVNTVGGWVVDQLEFDVDKYLTSPNDKTGTIPVKDAWNAFRVIALSLLIIVALLGILLGGFMDAYTVKKILPRLLVAIIAITLSWDLMILAINITNAAGVGVRALIDAPFANIDRPSISPLSILAGGGAASGLTTILGLLSFVGTAALAVLFAFIFVILRIGAIIMLVIFAPLAILLWILPGTQKGWNFWREGITGALLMFPIVTAFLSIGAAFGKILYNSDQDGLHQVMALVATYAPYFLIPKAFSMAGGLVANLSGMVNDQGRGAFDRLKKFRQDQGEKRRGDIARGKFFRGGNANNWRGKFNQGAELPFLIPKAGLGKNPTQWNQRLREASRDAAADHAIEDAKNPRNLRNRDEVVQKAFLDAKEGDMHWEDQEAIKDKRDKAEESITKRNQAAAQGKMGDAARHNADAASLTAEADALTAGARRASSIQQAREWYLEGNGAEQYGAGKKIGEDGKVRRINKKDAEYNDNLARRKGAKESALRQMERLEKTHGVETAQLIAARSISKSSTAFETAGDMVRLIRQVSHGDIGLETQLLEEFNANQNAAGRTDIGGGSYSVAISAINKVGSTRDFEDENGKITTRMYTDADADDEILLSTSKGKSAQQILASGKERVGKRVSKFVYEQARKDRKAIVRQADAEIAKIDPAMDEDSRNSEIARIRAKQEDDVIKSIVWEQSFHTAAANSSADHAEAFGKKSGEQFDLDSLPEDVRESITTRTEVVTEPDPANPGQKRPVRIPDPLHPGEFKPMTRVVRDENLTHSEVWNRLRNNPKWQQYAKEYGIAQAAANAAAAGAGAVEADAAAAGAAGAGTPEG